MFSAGCSHAFPAALPGRSLLLPMGFSPGWVSCLGYPLSSSSLTDFFVLVELHTSEVNHLRRMIRGLGQGQAFSSVPSSRASLLRPSSSPGPQLLFWKLPSTVTSLLKLVFSRDCPPTSFCFHFGETFSSGLLR